MHFYDVAIIGGGLVGASFARAITNLGLKSVLIDRASAQELYHPNLDNRGLAISYSTQQILAQLGVWPVLENKAFAIKDVHVSERNAFGFTRLSAPEHNLPALGYVISASNLGFALMNNLEQLPHLTIMRPENVTAFTYDTEQGLWSLTLSQQTIQAKLIVAADGSNSMVRAMQGISANMKDFAQHAIVTNIQMQHKNATTAFERFTSQGVLALLPFGSQQLKCIWTVDNSKLQEFMLLTDAEFLAAVQQAIGFRIGRLTGIAPRKNFPITYNYVEKLYGTGTVLIGNAANTLHPVAAQGFNLGIRDAFVLARTLQQANNLHMAINSESVLKKYAAARQVDHHNARKFSNNLVEIFAHDVPGIRFARRIGLVATQLLPGLKNRIITQGIGSWM